MRIRLLTLLAIVALSSACSSMIGAGRDEPMPDNEDDRSWGRMMDDEAIETKALVNIRKADQQLEDAHIVVVSFNGIVLLAGQVPSADLKQLAYNTLGEIRYIKRAHNELTIEPNTGFSKRSNDSWITTRIKSKMLFSSVVDPSAVKVVTERGVVYLMGLVDQKTADAAVEMARNTGGVQKVVRIFEYIDPPPA